jgi:PTS system nitrogen regulatory IIA component
MDIADYLHPHNVKINGSFSFKKHLFEALGRTATPITTLDKMAVATRLLERERLGCTYLGEGCALPHACLEPHELIHKDNDIHSVILILDNPIDYDPPHNKLVNVVFFILAVKGKKAQQALELARFRLKSPWVRENLRHAKTPKEAYTIISGPIHTEAPTSCAIYTHEHEVFDILPEV